MTIIRNGVFAVLAFSLLIGGLLVLVPTHVQAASVTSNIAGTVESDYSFDVLTLINIPSGERMPIDYAKVLVGTTNTVNAAGEIAAETCTATTLSIAPATPRVDPPVITEASNAYGALGFTNDKVVNGGSGPTLSAGAGAGYSYAGGYGYTAETPGGSILVTLHVVGCLNAGTFGSNHDVSRFVQAFVGINGATVPGLPRDTLFTKPGFVPPATDTGAPAVDTTPISSGNGLMGGRFTLKDNDGDATPFENIPAGSKVNDLEVPIPIGTSPLKFDLEVLEELPASTQIFIEMKNQASNPSEGAAPFPMDSASLASVSNGKVPSHFFQVKMSVPGLGFESPTGKLKLHIKLHIDPSYYTLTDATPAGTKMFAFNDDGNLEPQQPAPNLPFDTAGSNFEWDITHYSSFVVVSNQAAPIGGSGGSGGSGSSGDNVGNGGTGSGIYHSAPRVTGSPTPPIVTVVPTTSTAPVTTSTAPPPATTSSAAPIPTGSGKNNGGGGGATDSDGDGFTDTIETLMGSDPNSRTSVPNYDLSSKLTVTHEGTANHLSWNTNSKAMGYQVWRQDGSDWILAANVAAGHSTYDDASASGTVYKVTFFVGETIYHGKVNVSPGQVGAASRLGGWDEGTTASSEAAGTTALPSTATLPKTALIAIVAGVLVVVVLIVFLGRRPASS